MATKVDKLQEFEGKATRTPKLMYSLIPKAAVVALARRLTLGASRHGKNNWRQGGEGFRDATLDHLIDHLFDYIENGNRDDNNTDAIVCNAAFLCQIEEQYPYKGVDIADTAKAAKLVDTNHMLRLPKRKNL